MTAERTRRIDVFAETMTEKPSETLVRDSVISEASDDDLTGTMMAHFRVEELVRRGGMGSVWRAHDVSLDRPVALKVLTRELSQQPRLVERFVREARSQARLSHHNVVPIYFIGQEEGRMFFAMELIDGDSLADRLTRGETLDWKQAVPLMIGVGRALRHAHERGLIHRDIKPGNLLVDHGGHLKVTDFGLARSLDNDRRKLTGQGVFLGTPWYCSPEQARAVDVDHRSDMYALGATFYHVVCGRPVFDGKTPFAVLAQHAGDEPDLSPLEELAPPEFVALFERFLAKAPDGRFGDHDLYVQKLKAMR
jgi:serine/threonine-protein kinase